MRLSVSSYVHLLIALGLTAAIARIALALMVRP